MINMAEVNAIIRRFEEKEGVRGVIICDASGLPIKSNLPQDNTDLAAAYLTALIGKSRQVTEALEEGALKFIRLETSKGEIMIALEPTMSLVILK